MNDTIIKEFEKNNLLPPQFNEEVQHLEQLLQRSLHTKIISWERKVEEFANGYNATFEEFLNDLATREIIEQFINNASEELREVIQKILAPIDNKFIEVTKELKYEKESDAILRKFWRNRIPKNISLNFRDTFNIRPE